MSDSIPEDCNHLHPRRDGNEYVCDDCGALIEQRDRGDAPDLITSLREQIRTLTASKQDVERENRKLKAELFRFKSAMAISLPRAERCVFCHKELVDSTILDGCQSDNNPLPTMTNGKKPHALEAHEFRGTLLEAK